jgi:hypothetical protein
VTYDLEGVGNDADGHELLSVVTAVHHQRVGETLDDGALCLSESLLCVSAGGVGDVDWGPDLDVIAAERIVSHDLTNLPIAQFFHMHPSQSFSVPPPDRIPYVNEMSRISTSS